MIWRIVILWQFFIGVAYAAPTIMSADYCADQFVIALADKDQIVALSPDADKDFSYLREQSKGAPQRKLGAEEVARLKPDIILRSWGGDTARFERLGASVITLPYATNFNEIENAIRSVAGSLDAADRGEALIDDMQQRLTRLKLSTIDAPAAVYVTPGGVTAGAGTLIDAIINAAGVKNAIAEAGFSGWPALPAESIFAKPPALIITGFFDTDAERANNWSITRHASLRRLFAKTPTIHLAPDTLTCPAWFAVDAAEKIAEEASRLSKRQTP